MSELKPCPFCGASCLQIVSGQPGCHYVKCESCKVTTDDTSRSRAITAWNTRADDAEIERLRRIENAARAIQQDLMNRAEWDGEAKVVVAGSGAWFRLCEALGDTK